MAVVSAQLFPAGRLQSHGSKPVTLWSAVGQPVKGSHHQGSPGRGGGLSPSSLGRMLELGAGRVRPSH